MSEADVDPEELQRQLDQIKGAMGIEERYPGQRRMWLVYGAVVGGVAVLTNLSFVFELPNWAYVAGWFGMVGVVVLAQWRLVSGASGDRSGVGVNWVGFVGALAAGLVALWLSVGDLIAENTEGALRGAHFFSHALVFLGLGFLLTGAVLRAERVRRRDRLPFYVGGLWILLFAGFVPHVRFLQLSGYAVFGVLFFVHGVATYLLTGGE